MKTLPPAMIPAINTTIKAHNNDDEEDPISEYLVVMAANETRPWNEIFDDMGYNITQTISAHDHFTTFGDDNNNHASFKTEEGIRIDTWGKSMRAFTMKMKASEADAIVDSENIFSLHENEMGYASVMPRDETDVAAEQEFAKAQNETWPEEEFSAITKRQNTYYADSVPEQTQEQNTAPWNLQRVSTTGRVNANGRRATDLTFNYVFGQEAGSGVDVYVVDSGINTAHADFGGRAVMGFSAFGNNNQDDVGHGSHCSGTIGGRRFGVAKNVNLVGVKVLAGPSGSGSTAAIMGGLQFAYQRHMQRMNEPDFKGSVISMSLGGRGRPASVRQALQMASNAGMHISVAAGNDNADACGFWPAGFSADMPIITVGATDINDNRASFSNFGRCVDIHAPGVAIVSDHNRGPQSITSMQGTSMACPAVSGMIADELVRNPNLKLDPRGMKNLILSKSVKGVVRGANNAPNMLNNGLR
ncbi:Cerevisin [Arthrobotrys entomopaga]|nr:Cerevisin [Arthrobotrys entomopaga]